MSRWDPDEPTTSAEVNERLIRLADDLELQQPALEALMAEYQRVSLRYELQYASVVQTSELRSEDKRKAEATAAMYEAYLDDSPVDLATRRSELEMRIKAAREAAHNIRASLSALQSLASNLRAEMSLGGGVRR